MVRTLVFTSSLPISTTALWDLVKKTKTLRVLGRGFVFYQGKLPRVWKVGPTAIDIKPKFTKFPWSLLPTQSHFVKVVEVDALNMRIKTQETGGFITRWDHVMEIEPSQTPDECIYKDTITLDAGIFTPILVMLVKQLYRHRHKRWREITEENMKQPKLQRRP